MEKILVSDDELIYLIRQNDEEAKRLLFLRYEKFKRKMLEKINLSLYDSLDNSTIESLYYEAVIYSIDNFEFERGYFFFFVRDIFEKNLISYYRKYKYKSRNEILLKDYDEDNICLELNDDNSYQINSLDFNLIVNYIKEEDPLSYRVLILWLKGYRYTEISKRLNIHEKRVYYLLNKAIGIAKDKVNK